MQLSRIRLKIFSLLVIVFIPFCSARADLLVTDGTNHTVLRYSNGGIALGTFISSGSGGQVVGPPLFGPDGNLYFLGSQNEVLRYNGSTGAFIDTFVPSGSGGLVPTAMVFGPDGNLYVADRAQLVRRYNGTTGAYMGVFTSGYTLVVPAGLAFGPDGNLYVADEVNVVKFDGTTGAFLSIFVANGSGGLLGPGNLIFRPDGFLYIGSAHSGVRRYDAQTGAFVSQIVPDFGVRSDGGLAFGPDGNIYVAFFNFGNPTDFVNSYDPNTDLLVTEFVVPAGAAGVIGGIAFTPISTQVTAVVPDHGGNSGAVTIQVVGGNFQPGAQLRLSGIGSDIFGTPASIVGASVISATFDLVGAPVGPRDVVVANPDGTSAVLASAFTVEQGGVAQISGHLVVSNLVRVGHLAAVYPVLTNSGLIDSGMAFYSVNSQLTPSGPTTLLSGFTSVFSQFSDLLPPRYISPQSLGCNNVLMQAGPVVSGLYTCDETASLINAAQDGQEILQKERLLNLDLILIKIEQGKCYFLTLGVTNETALCDGLLDADQVENNLATLTDLGTKSLCADANSNGCPIDCHLFDIDPFEVLANSIRSEIESVKKLANLTQLDQQTITGLDSQVKNIQSNSLSRLPCNDCALPSALSTPESTAQICAVSSIDPNSKIGTTGAGNAQYVSSAFPIPYTINFENLQSAIAPAQNIVITDNLDPSRVDLTKVALGLITLGNESIAVPSGKQSITTIVDLRPAQNLLVRVTAGVDPVSGVLTWNFQSLDPSTGLTPTDPTAGFLPPGGSGSVFFTVRPTQGLSTNTQIQNQATVVFDANPPINTPTWSNTLDNDAPISHIAPLPATEYSTSLTVQWTGADVGAGLQDFTIYVSDNNGTFSPFMTNTTATSAAFTGQPGHTYGFYSIARDLVGNVEAAKSAAETTTLVTTDTTPPVTTAVASPAPNGAGWNNSNVTITLNSTDNAGGSGVNQIQWSLSGAQMGSSTVPGSNTTVTISAEGNSTLTFFATDNAGNIEIARSIAIRLDKTPPSVTGSRAPTPNASGWNNSPVTASFQCADTLSGLAAGSPPVATILAAEGAGQSVSATCLDIAGNAASATVRGINIDRTPPILTITSNPPSNAAGWNNSNVTVSFAGVDSLSGIGAISSPVTVASEGAGQIVAGSVTDLAGNVTPGSVSVSLDKTPPEVFNQFDPISRNVVLLGRDSLSGVAPGPINPVSIVSLGRSRDDDGDDMGCPDGDDVRKELRTYRILDLAGNPVVLVEKVKMRGQLLRAKFVSIQYGVGPVTALPRNRESFDWILAKDGRLKELEQELRIAPNWDAARVEGDFDARSNTTTIVKEAPKPKTKVVKQGLDLLHMATSVGELSIEF